MPKVPAWLICHVLSPISWCGTQRYSKSETTAFPDLSRIASPNTPSIWFLAPTQLFLRKRMRSANPSACGLGYIGLGLTIWYPKIQWFLIIFIMFTTQIATTSCHIQEPNTQGQWWSIFMMHRRQVLPCLMAVWFGCQNPWWLPKQLANGCSFHQTWIKME